MRCCKGLLALVAVLCAALFVSSIALAGESLRGTFKAKVTSTALHGEVKGTWKLEFQRNGYLVVVQNGRRDGKTRFSTSGSQLTLKASPGCRSRAVYNFTLRGDKLSFKRVKDSCAPRKILFSYRFTRVG